MNLLKHLAYFLLYGNVWIALCALCMCWQTEWILIHEWVWHPYWGFLFFSTVTLYAAHRLIGLPKVMAFNQEGRFKIFARYQWRIILTAGVAAIGSVYYFFQLPVWLILWLLPGSLLSVAYILPFFKSRIRLRDFNYIKIFVIAVVWAWLTATIPAIYREVDVLTTVLISLERAAFIFAITLPFDIRDMYIDRQTEVKTLPIVIGIEQTKRLALVSLVIAFGLSLGMYFLAIYSLKVLLALTLAYLLTYLLVYYAEEDKPDYYFTAWLDGSMIMQFLIVYFFST